MMEEYFVVQHCDFLMKKDHSFGVAVDIGANRGEWTHVLAQRFEKVIAVEPDWRAFVHLSRHLPANAVILDKPVSDRNGLVDFYSRSGSEQSSLLKTHPIGAAACSETSVVEVEQCSAITLDDINAGFGPIDFVKIDVEGAEHLVLDGATPERFKGTRWLIECHDNREEVGKALMKLGVEKITMIPHIYKDAHPGHFWVLTQP